ncbi:hypothetical protein [Rhodococcus qingshengii]|uniref:hypothetical protein n=1 Tax=Rhodococcus qingshengii TaxID=334542 RepID=UPI001C5DA798|nr:hypothetical protein [Rhodococcus qingshengii]MBW4818397.1 hypothetical protein [Rhodococcus qingshengii]
MRRTRSRRYAEIGIRLREERDLVAFAARWFPFGGAPAEDVMLTFGLRPSLYYTRLGHVLDYYTSNQLGVSPEMHALLRERCWGRIYAAESTIGQRVTRAG